MAKTKSDLLLLYCVALSKYLALSGLLFAPCFLLFSALDYGRKPDLHDSL